MDIPWLLSALPPATAPQGREPRASSSPGHGGEKSRGCGVREAVLSWAPRPACASPVPESALNKDPGGCCGARVGGTALLLPPQAKSQLRNPLHPASVQPPLPARQSLKSAQTCGVPWLGTGWVRLWEWRRHGQFARLAGGCGQGAWGAEGLPPSGELLIHAPSQGKEVGTPAGFPTCTDQNENRERTKLGWRGRGRGWL